MKVYQKKIRPKVNDAFDEDSHMPFLERIVFIYIGVSAALVFVSLIIPVLFATVPIWGIPYMVWKNRMNNKVREVQE